MSTSDDVKRFSAFLKQKEQAAEQQRIDDQAKVEAERARAEAARLLADARAAKDTAASRLRDARRGTNNARITEAEADYRAALALVLEREQGTRPTWAPKINVEQPENNPSQDT